MRTFPPLYKRTSAGAIQQWAIAVRKNKDDTGTIVITQGQVDGKKQQYQEDITEGKNLGRKNATTAFQQAVAEATSRWEKKRDRHHYGEDVAADESATRRALAPMLAQVYEKNFKKVDWKKAMAQPKLDGDRMDARCEGKKITLWSRKGVQIFSLPQVVDGLQGLLRNGETFDGEAYIHGMHVTNLSGLLRRKKPDSETEKVSFRVYDQMIDAPFYERISDLNERLGDWVAAPKDSIALVETIRVMNDAELMKFQRECIEQGFEGAMLRWGMTGYEAGKRSSSLLKVKTFQDAEFTILNVIASEGTFNLVDPVTGKVKHVQVAVFVCKTKNGHRFTVTAPGTILQKYNILKRPNQFIGKQVELKYAGYTKTEEPVPFQPVAKQVRED